MLKPELLLVLGIVAEASFAGMARIMWLELRDRRAGGAAIALDGVAILLAAAGPFVYWLLGGRPGWVWPLMVVPAALLFWTPGLLVRLTGGPRSS
jgi:hypothetical protein